MKPYTPPRIDFMGKRKLAFFFSIFLTLGSIFLVFQKGLNFGIDFSGGIVMEIRTNEPLPLAKMRGTLANQGLGEVSLQHFGSDNDILIRLQQQAGGEKKAVEAIKQAMAANFPDYQIDYRKVDYVGAQVGGELIKSGVIALVLAYLAIMFYLWVRFEWQYSIGAIITLLHDGILTMGFFSATGLEFNLTSVAAILTIVGYSVNDSVVIYDRIRENLRKYKKMPLEELINLSTNETLARTLKTVATTLVATLALALWGGEVIKSFSYAMLFGVAFGTYSSIYISAPVLIFTHLRNGAATEGELAKSAG